MLATHGSVGYGTSRSIQSSCMPLMLVTWTLFRYPDMWDKFDLDCILGKGIQLLRYFKNLDVLEWTAYHKNSC